MTNSTTTEQSSKDKSYFPLAGGASDGWSTDDEATATCFCGAVQMVFPTHGPGLVETFVCHCADCRKITASMFASNFTIADKYIRYVRGRENLKQFGQNKTIASGNRMTNHFCSTCGTLMFRVGEQFPGMSIMRIGTVDDFSLHETKLRPGREQFVECRVDWLGHDGIEGMKQYKGMPGSKL
ncbi:glutathione-dependent formaldehyde-activating gfa protein [Rutstroemia sp. NJR-2017a BBW]|nr:glutathione-dependent formaldehyde-activating gfa protein [Rutstroemia sp. NJR-2017a BBW]